MKLTAESTVINDSKINTDIDGAQTTADNAQSTANTAVSKADTAQATADSAKSIAEDTAQYFWFKSTGSDTGAHISEKTQAQFEASPSGGNLLARSNGIAVRSGLTELASFGTAMRIGEQSKSHVDVDYHSLQLIDKEGDTYLWVSDLRDNSGVAYVTDVFWGDGTTKAFTLHLDGIEEDTASVKVDGSTVTNWSLTRDLPSLPLYVLFTTAPANGAKITVTYGITFQTAKAFTFGNRHSNSTTGVMSFSAGDDTYAEGAYATAFGSWTQSSGEASFSHGSGAMAKGDWSHAEGRNTEALGTGAHAEGSGTKANGDYSHASGLFTTANGLGQTVIGRNNVPDTNMLFIIGNGTVNGTVVDLNDASNAFTVDILGNVTIPDDAEYRGGYSKTNFTPTRGSNYAGYGGCYYEKFGSVVHVHVGVSGLTANTATNILTLPSGFRPPSLVFAHGTGGAWNNLGYLQVDSSGVVMVRSEGTYCGADVTFMV